MARVTLPHRLNSDWGTVVPLINDNFEKMVENVADFSPVTTTTGGAGAYIPTTYLFHAIMVVYDQPEYDRFATFT